MHWEYFHKWLKNPVALQHWSLIMIYKAQITSYLIKDVGTNVLAYSILHRTTGDVAGKESNNLSVWHTGGVCTAGLM